MTLPSWVPPQITQLFDLAIGEYGNDFAVPTGTPIYSPVAGVFGAEHNGKTAWGDRGIVYASSGLSFAVGHLTSFAKQAGERVNVGDLIGYSGGAVTDPNSGQSTGPHVEVQFFAGPIQSAASYVDPQKVPGFGELEKLIFGAAQLGAKTVASGPPGLPDLNPLDALAGALKGFNDWIGRALWLGVGLALIALGLMLLVFEDFEGIGRELAKTAAANPELVGVG